MPYICLSAYIFPCFNRHLCQCICVRSIAEETVDWCSPPKRARPRRSYKQAIHTITRCGWWRSSFNRRCPRILFCCWR